MSARRCVATVGAAATILVLWPVLAAAAEGGGADSAWVAAVERLTWPGAVTATVLGFLYSNLGKNLAERIKTPVLTPPVQQSTVAEALRDVSHTLKEVSTTQKTMGESLADLAKLVREMQEDQREIMHQSKQVLSQQHQMLSEQRAVQVQLAELVGRVASIQQRG